VSSDSTARPRGTFDGTPVAELDCYT